MGSLRLVKLLKTGTRGTLIAILALLAAACGESPESSSRALPEKADQEVSEAILADAREAASDLGISVEEAVAAIERQPQVGRLQVALNRHRPNSFGGLFIDYIPEYQIVLLSLPGRSEEVTRAVDELGFAELSPFVRVRETPYTEDVLKDAMRMVSDLGGSRLTTLDLDIRTGEILATVASPEDADAVTAAVDATGSGRQWKAEFSIGHTGGMYEDIGFSGPASIDLKIPKLESGRYRLGQEFIRPGRDPLEDRLVWHYAEFEVVE